MSVILRKEDDLSNTWSVPMLQTDVSVFREVTGQFYEDNASNMIPKRLYIIKGEFCFKMQT